MLILSVVTAISLLHFSSIPPRHFLLSRLLFYLVTLLTLLIYNTLIIPTPHFRNICIIPSVFKCTTTRGFLLLWQLITCLYSNVVIYLIPTLLPLPLCWFQFLLFLFLLLLPFMSTPPKTILSWLLWALVSPSIPAITASDNRLFFISYRPAGTLRPCWYLFQIDLTQYFLLIPIALLMVATIFTPLFVKPDNTSFPDTYRCWWLLWPPLEILNFPTTFYSIQMLLLTKFLTLLGTTSLLSLTLPYAYLAPSLFLTFLPILLDSLPLSIRCFHFIFWMIWQLFLSHAEFHHGSLIHLPFPNPVGLELHKLHLDILFPPLYLPSVIRCCRCRIFSAVVRCFHCCQPLSGRPGGESYSFRFHLITAWLNSHFRLCYAVLSPLITIYYKFLWGGDVMMHGSHESRMTHTYT